MFEIKKLDFGFIIVCPNLKSISLKNTVKSLKYSHPGCPVIAVVPNNVKAETLKEMKEICNVYKGKSTVTSWMNTGLRNTTTNWNVFIVSGNWIKNKIIDKFSKFINDDSDILFPIMNGIYNFKDCDISGLCINRKVFKEVGPFAEQGAIDKCKEEWSIYAHGMCGSKFKAILGIVVES